MVASASACEDEIVGADKLLQHSCCRTLSQAAGCKKGRSPEVTRRKSIFGLRAAKMDGAHTMNTTYRWELDVTPRRRLGTFVDFWTLLVATVLKNVTRSSVSPSMRRHLPQRLASVRKVFACWNISVEYTMILGRISTRRTINSPAALSKPVLLCFALTPREQSNTC